MGLYEHVVALTGSIGSGKTAAANAFAELGAVIISADKLARQVLSQGSPLLASVAQEFGSAVIGPDGSLEREKLAGIVFKDAKLRAKLEQLTHPVIHQAAIEQFKTALKNKAPLVVYDCPLFFEAGLDNLGFRAVVLVCAPEQLCLERVVRRDNSSENLVLERLKAQLPAAEKAARADFVINNSATVDELKDNVRKVFDKLCS